jgi:hypothetical protein
MSQPKSLVHVGSWVLLILVNLAGLSPLFQKSGYLPLDPANVMVVRPSPAQDVSMAASIAVDPSQTPGSFSSSDKVLVLVHSRYRSWQLTLTCLSSLALILLILATRTRGTAKLPAAP